MSTLKLWLAALGVGLLAGSAAAQPLPDDKRLEAIEFAVNNSVFVLYHEIGHLYIGEFDLPVLGKEEDAADTMGALSLLEEQTEAANAALIDSANGWYLSEYSDGGTTYDETDFFDEHSLDIQRSYLIVCMMVGSDSATYRTVADDFGMGPDRRQTCAFDYRTASRSWHTLLANHAKPGGSGKKIEVIYEPASKRFAFMADALKGRRFLETAAERLTSNYNLPRNLTFRAEECEEENAYYNYDAATVTFCYELAAFYYELKKKQLTSSPEQPGTIAKEPTPEPPAGSETASVEGEHPAPPRAPMPIPTGTPKVPLGTIVPPVVITSNQPEETPDDQPTWDEIEPKTKNG